MCNCCWNVVTYKWKVHNGKIEISHEVSFLLSISSCICGEHYFKYNSPTKVKHHLTCFNNIFSNSELISNRFAVFVTCTHILTYL